MTSAASQWSGRLWIGRHVGRWVAIVGAAVALAGCSIKDIITVPRPSGVLDPKQLQTYNGAISMANGAQGIFNVVFGGSSALNGSGIGIVGPFSVAGGVLADEFSTWSQDILDGRSSDFGSPGGANTIFSFIGNAHMNAGQAIRYLHAYASNAPTQYLANMFIVRAYTDIFLSELYCSGVPVSDASADGSVVYTGAVSRDSLQKLALAEFDSALAYAPTDSAAMRNFIALGKARAYMNLKQYDQAAPLVAAVPTGFAYKIQYAGSPSSAQPWFYQQQYVTAVDVEGINGLNFRSAHDPRLSFDSVANYNGIPIWVPHNMHSSTYAAPVESGINARLYEAEVLLSHQDYPGWLNKLNDLRANGGVAGLAPLVDPGNDHDRLLLTFRERAFWLYATGHRLGDLRRLVRQYGIPQNSVFPIGAWRDGLQFGSFTNSVPDPLEVKYNPKYTGCIDRDA